MDKKIDGEFRDGQRDGWNARRMDEQKEGKKGGWV